MNTTSLSLVESLKELIQALEARFLFPSILLVTFNIIILNKENIIKDTEVFNNFDILFIISIIIIVSYILSSLNGVFIRTVEGYNFNIHFFLKKEREKYNEISNKIKNYNIIKDDINKLINDIYLYKELNEKNQISQTLIKLENLLEKLLIEYKIKIERLKNQKEKRFSDSKLLMTPIGNVIAAFEYYPFKRYGIDSIALWTRLCPILEEKKFLSIIQKERVTFDFLLNSSLIFFLIMIESFYFYFFYNTTLFYLFIMICSFVFLILFLYGAFNVAMDWGTLVSTSFDLYRDDLRKALRIKDIPNNLEEEKKMWKEISTFIKHGEGFDNFYYDDKG